MFKEVKIIVKKGNYQNVFSKLGNLIEIEIEKGGRREGIREEQERREEGERGREVILVLKILMVIMKNVIRGLIKEKSW